MGLTYASDRQLIRNVTDFRLMIMNFFSIVSEIREFDVGMSYGMPPISYRQLQATSMFHIRTEN